MEPKLYISDPGAARTDAKVRGCPEGEIFGVLYGTTKRRITIAERVPEDTIHTLYEENERQDFLEGTTGWSDSCRFVLIDGDTQARLRALYAIDNDAFITLCNQLDAQACAQIEEKPNARVCPE